MIVRLVEIVAEEPKHRNTIGELGYVDPYEDRCPSDDKTVHLFTADGKLKGTLYGVPEDNFQDVQDDEQYRSYALLREKHFDTVPYIYLSLDFLGEHPSYRTELIFGENVHLLWTKKDNINDLISYLDELSTAMNTVLCVHPLVKAAAEDVTNGDNQYTTMNLLAAKRWKAQFEKQQEKK